MARTGGRILTGITVIVALVIGLGVAQKLDFLPSFSNPVKETTVDRTGPAVLQALADLSDYHGATGDYSVTVDLEKDTKYVPSAILGEHAMYEAIGSVDGVVDLSQIDTRGVDVSKDRVVTVIVPHATLSDVNLDVEQSKVVARKRGVLNRIGSIISDSPTSEKNLQIAGRKKLAAAANESELLARAEKNTKAMLTNLLQTAGAERVIVKFGEPTGSPAN